jgi:hypothetical protein
MDNKSINKYAVDYNKLNKKIKYDDVKNQLVKVAFDVYKFKSDDRAKLWQLHSADDGNYIVALYDEDTLMEKKSDWQVVKSASDVSFYYKDEYIVKLPLSSFGGLDVESELPRKLGESKNLVNLLLKNVNSKVKSELLKKFPNLV